jgi:hypothetical protein
MEPQEFDLPIKPEVVRCQIYNEWTVGDTGIAETCRLIVQSPTGAAYYIDYPTFDKYYHLAIDGTPEKEIGNHMFAFLHAIISDTSNIHTETWSMPVPIAYLELIRDYGKPIDMPKPDWMETWWDLQKAMHEVSNDLDFDDLFDL